MLHRSWFRISYRPPNVYMERYLLLLGIPTLNSRSLGPGAAARRSVCGHGTSARPGTRAPGAHTPVGEWSPVRVPSRSRHTVQSRRILPGSLASPHGSAASCWLHLFARAMSLPPLRRCALRRRPSPVSTPSARPAAPLPLSLTHCPLASGRLRRPFRRRLGRRLRRRRAVSRLPVPRHSRCFCLLYTSPSPRDS